MKYNKVQIRQDLQDAGTAVPFWTNEGPLELTGHLSGPSHFNSRSFPTENDLQIELGVWVSVENIDFEDAKIGAVCPKCGRDYICCEVK